MFCISVKNDGRTDKLHTMLNFLNCQFPAQQEISFALHLNFHLEMVQLRAVEDPELRGLLPENTRLVVEGTHSVHTWAEVDKTRTGHFQPEEAVGSCRLGKSSTQTEDLPLVGHWKLGMLHPDMYPQRFHLLMAQQVVHPLS